MDLLETILRSSGYEEYHDIFKQHGIDSYTLKIINDQDLKQLGMQDEEKIRLLLKHINNLQIPSEKKISLVVDKSYTLLMLHQMSFHLQKQMANLIYVLKREDIDICDVKITPAILALESVLSSLQSCVDTFEEKVFKGNKSKKKKRNILIPTLLVAAIVLTTYSGYLSLKK